MGLALLIIGVLLAGVGIRGTQGQLAALLVGDFSGAGSFWYWIAGLFFAGSIGYYPAAREVSRLTIILILLVLLLSNQGFWAKLVDQLKAPKTSAAPGPEAAVSPTSASTIDPVTGQTHISNVPGTNSGDKVIQSPIPGNPGLNLTSPFAGFSPLDVMNNLLSGSAGK